MGPGRTALAAVASEPAAVDAVFPAPARSRLVTDAHALRNVLFCFSQKENVHLQAASAHPPIAQTAAINRLSVPSVSVYFQICAYIFLHYKGQVDWAALAQAWIAQKESTGSEPQNIQPNGQDIPGLEPVGQSNHGTFQGDPAFGRMWQPGMSLTTGIVTGFYILPLILSSLPFSFLFLYWKWNGNWSTCSVLTYGRLLREIV